MSRSLNRVRIAITPSCIGVQQKGEWHELPAVSVHHRPDLAGLAEQLRSQGVQGDAEITLSARVAPTWLLPPPPVRLKQSEMEGWVSDQLATRFGDLAESWRLSWDAPAPGEPVLVTAVDLVWFEQLVDAVRSVGITPQRVQPWLSVAYRNSRHHVQQRDAWLALIEPGQISLAGFTGGTINSLRSATFNDQADVIEVLTGMLQREALLAPQITAEHIWIKPVLITADWQRLGISRVHLSPSFKSRLAAMGDD